MIELYDKSTILTSAEELADILRGIQASRNMALDRIEELEREETDILHEMERPRCLYDERAKLATRLQKILAERRQLKDWLRMQRDVLKYMDSDKGANLQKWLEGFIGTARKITEFTEDTNDQ